MFIQKFVTKTDEECKTNTIMNVSEKMDKHGG